MFFSVVRQGSRRSFCSMYPTWPFWPVMSLPSSRMHPDDGLMSPAMMLKSVDFPQPLGPIMLTNRPLGISSEISSRAVTCVPPFVNTLLTWTTSSLSCTLESPPPCSGLSLLHSLSDGEQQALVPVSTDELQTDRQALAEAAWHGKGGMAGKVEGGGIDGHGARPADDPLEVRIVHQLERFLGRGRHGQDVDAPERLVHLLAQQHPEVLRLGVVRAHVLALQVLAEHQPRFGEQLQVVSAGSPELAERFLPPDVVVSAAPVPLRVGLEQGGHAVRHHPAPDGIRVSEQGDGDLLDRYPALAEPSHGVPYQPADVGLGGWPLASFLERADAEAIGRPFHALRVALDASRHLAHLGVPPVRTGDHLQRQRDFLHRLRDRTDVVERVVHVDDAVRRHAAVGGLDRSDATPRRGDATATALVHSQGDVHVAARDGGTTPARRATG